MIKKGKVRNNVKILYEDVHDPERSKVLSIFNNLNVFVYVSDIDTYEILYASDSLTNYFGRALTGELCYKKFHGLNHPCADCTNHIILKEKPNHINSERHNSFLKKDFAVVDQVIKWPDGRDVRLEFAIDVTSQKNTERSLKDANRRLSDIIEFLPDATLVIDSDKKIMGWNRAMEIMTGVPKENMLGKCNYEYALPFYGTRRPILIDLIDGVTIDMVKYYDNYNITGNVMRAEMFVPSLYNGRGAFILGIASPLLDAEGRFCGAIESCQDITSRKFTEQALVESEAKFRGLAASAQDGIVVMEEDGTCSFWNDAAEKIFGYTSGEILGKQLHSVLAPGFFSAFEKTYHLFRETGKGKVTNRVTEFVVSRKDGAEISIELSVSPLNFRNKWMAIGILRDISGRKKIEKELENYRHNLENMIEKRTTELQKVNTLLRNEMLKQREAEKKVNDALIKEKEFSDLKTRFLATVSHKFRTPLSVIMSSAELIELYGSQMKPELYKEHFDSIKNNVSHLAGILEDMLTISRSELGHVKFGPSKTDLKSLCANTIESVKVMMNSEQTISLKYRLRQVYFWVDVRLVTQFLSHLLSNAIKYSYENGHIELTVRSRKGKLIFKIEDNGIGIPKADQAALFEPFYRGSNVGGTLGTGLGLLIIKRAVEMHSGTVDFVSREGKGTIFTVVIPVCIKANEDA